MKTWQKIIDEWRYYYDLPGLAVSLSWDGTNWEGVSGLRDLETAEPLQLGDIFHMASISKLFTGTGIMMLEEEGKLSLEDRILDLMPELALGDPKPGERAGGWAEEITIASMLTHTSGLADVEDYGWDRPRADENALHDYCHSEAVRRPPMLWAPSEGKFRYSNMAYEILGCLIAQVSGMTYEAFMEERILRPLGMEDSTFLTAERDPVNMAGPYEKDEENHFQKVAHYPYNREHAPSSTLTANGADLGKWARAHLERRLLKEESYEKVWETYATVPNNGEEMGLSWFMRRQAGLQLMGHEGSDDGFRSSFWICPRRKGYVIVTSNLSNAPVKKISKQIVERLEG